MQSSIDWGSVADLYDEYVRAEFDIPFFVEESKQGGDVLELMCGTGRVTLPLLRSGVALTAVDNSPEMLAVLRHKLSAEGFSIPVHRMDVRQLALHRQFDLILLPFHSFGEFLAAADRQAVLARIHDHLRPGARAIITLHNPPERSKTIDGQLRLAGQYEMPDGKLLLWIWQQQRPGETYVSGMQFYEEYDSTGRLRAKRMLEIRFALVEPDEFRELVQNAGLAVDTLYGSYEREPFDPASSPFQIWLLRKDGARTSRTRSREAPAGRTGVAPA